jgi:hypothetical protein
MPVSYRYHAYSPQRLQEGRRLKRRSKKKLTESELANHPHEAETGLHYGHRFAETEERAHAKAKQAKAHPKMSTPQRGMPIGALPETDEPITEPDRLLEGEVLGMDDLVREAMAQLEVITGAIRDLGESSWKLARFPLDAARAFRQRGRRH